ncbi:MAG TPA: hypothetical protein VIF09_19090 [Polyangiaceae bacterium]
MKRVAWVGLVALFVPATASGAPAPIAARPLKPLPGSKETLEGWRSRLCALPDLACSPDPTQLSLYSAAGDPPDAAWAILASDPLLAKLHRSQRSGAWVVEQTWDLAPYARSQGSRFGENAVAIHPALYPVGPGVWAVALVEQVHEMYSGGGADFEFADFVVLTDARAPLVAY